MKPFGWVGLFIAILLGTLGGMAPNQCVAQNQIDLAQFDSWIFQRHGRDEARCRSALKKEIELRFVRIEQSTPLTEGQKDVLRLAGHGDIKRFFDRVNKARETFLNMKQDNDNRNINEAYQLASPLQQELTKGIFGDGSLVQKVTRYVMTEEQATELQEREIEQFRALLSAQASLFLATLGRSMALTAKQQRQLQGHIKKRIEQIQKTPSGKLPFSFYQTIFIKWIAESQEEEAASILDTEQTKVIENLAENARAALPMLKKEGLIQ